MLKAEITKDQFDEMISALIDRTIFIMNTVLEDSGFTWDNIDKILLVGGSTRVKRVQEAIEKASGKKPSSEVNPDEAVAIGAALQAYILSDDSVDETIVKPKITDVNSHSLGILSWNPDNEQLYNTIILPRNTPIPAEAYNDFNTMSDNQDHIELEVTEGEDEDPEYVKIIGKTILNIKKRAAGSPIRVVVAYDENSVVHVRVIDLIDNEDLGEMEIQRTSNLSDEEVNIKAAKLSKINIE
jgi:molecular chaperone DnaK